MSPEPAPKICVGIPYRTRKEELSNKRDAYDKYVAAVAAHAAEPVEISLGLSASELQQLAQTLDAVILPGSPADIEPALFNATRHPKTAESDADRERTDFALLGHAVTEHKPVLAICYGVQSLNVFLGGALVQDIPSAIHTKIQHAWTGHEGPEPHHDVTLDAGSRLAQLAGATKARVNSSHHQSVLQPGNNLRVVAHAPDGVIEAIEWTGDANWIVGVQWHPERMVRSEELSQSLFRELAAAAAARKAPVHS
ncbi:MAG TPA: gamma-glutamyl-gamma-aminobutyrate hydrolase family protein [Candidatus Cybelea sp.]|nr:gamma-glutamyl-gamma-aminobutyrate hydrolase family protein [Candidatus Cybelea sp.]